MGGCRYAVFAKTSVLLRAFLTRYNMERLSNDMNRVVRLTNWREPIEQGYFPKLDNIVANRVWPPRPANAKLQVMYRVSFMSPAREARRTLFTRSLLVIPPCYSTERQQRCRANHFRHRRPGTVERSYI